ncbi:MAG: hypothetical protein CMH70_06835 [Nitrosomonadaceae bacterium]|nr:hypothetical protein [Nitrosomonadaceae bacterium]|tara:strand:+ start:12891 stop:13208 length:318 start_codon:yes stop_codon:yes gene_type:complete
MSKGIFSKKLAASTRKAKKIIPEVKPRSASTLVTNQKKAKKIIPEVKLKSASSLVVNRKRAKKIISDVNLKAVLLRELTSPSDILNPTDSKLLLNQQYEERIWPD